MALFHTQFFFLTAAANSETEGKNGDVEIRWERRDLDVEEAAEKRSVAEQSMRKSSSGVIWL